MTCRSSPSRGSGPSAAECCRRRPVTARWSTRSAAVSASTASIRGPAVGEERGSVLMLMPAAVLVFLVLGALCVDFGSAYDAQRELASAATAAANDAAGRAIDVELLYTTG